MCLSKNTYYRKLSYGMFGFLTSGTVVMFIQCAPQKFHILLSALDENLGPSIVSIVPPLCTLYPNSCAVLYMN